MSAPSEPDKNVAKIDTSADERGNVSTDAQGALAAAQDTAHQPPTRDRRHRKRQFFRFLKRNWPLPDLDGFRHGLSGAGGEREPAAELPANVGRFVVIRRLGEGGFGTVYLAHDPRLRRHVAVKVPHPWVRLSGDLQKRFEREARAAAALDHPNINNVYETGRCEHGLYISSHYCDGPTLAEWLRARGAPAPGDSAARLIAHLASGVQHAHDRGVLHRDVKPANVLLDPPDTTRPDGGQDAPLELFIPRLADFGLAKLAGDEHSQTQAGALAGTVRYMSPEQASGRSQEVGARSDVYALGTILYELLTGRPPFVGDTDLETLRQLQSDNPLPVRRLQPSVARDLEVVCLKCLQKEPRHRYQTAGELAEDLTRYLDRRPVLAQAPSTARKLWLWCRRRPAVATVLAGTLLVALGGPAGLLWHSMQLQQAVDVAETQRQVAEAAQLRAEENATIAAASARAARQSEARVREHIQVADLRLAHRLRQEGDIVAMSQLLVRHGRGAKPGDLSQPAAEAPRGFEWNYLNRFRDALRTTISAHRGAVDLLEFSADGSVLASSGTTDGQVRLWSAVSGEQLAAFPVRTESFRRWEERAAAISADARRVAALADAHTIVVWDAQSGVEIARLQHDRPVLTLTFLSDGTRVVGGDDRETRIWSCETGQVVRVIPAAARLLAVSPTGHTLALVDENSGAIELQIYDLVIERLLYKIQHHAAIRGIRYLPTDAGIACLVGANILSICNPRNATSGRYGLGNETTRFSDFALSADGRRIGLVASAGEMQEYGMQDHCLVNVLRGPATRLSRLAFSPDGRLVATAAPDGRIYLWDRYLLNDHDELAPAPAMTGLLQFSPDGQTLAAGLDDFSLVLIDVPSQRVVSRLPRQGDRIRDVCFSPDGRRVLITDGQSQRCWNRDDASLVWTIDWDYHGTRCLAWAPQGDLVASGGNDKLIHLRNSADGVELGTLARDGGAVSTLRFIPGTRQLISGCSDGAVQVDDVDTRTTIGAPQHVTGRIAQMALAGDRRALAAGRLGGAVSIWTISEEHRLDKLLFENRWIGDDSHSSFGFLPDNRTFVQSESNRSIHGYDFASKRGLFLLSGRQAVGTTLNASPRDNIIATVADDGALTTWDLDRWQMRTFAGAPLLPVRSLAFSPDAQVLAVGYDNSLRADDRETRELPDGPYVRHYQAPRLPVSLLTQRLFTSDGPTWIASDPGFRLWNVASGVELARPEGYSTLTSIPLVAWSRTGLLATGSRDGSVALWSNKHRLLSRFTVNPAGPDVTQWQPAVGQPPRQRAVVEKLDSIGSVAFSIDGNRLAVATRQGVLQTLDVRAPEKRATLATDLTDIAELVFLPNSSTLLAARGETLLLFESDRLPPREIESSHGAAIRSLTFSHDGRRLALGRDDGTIEVQAVAALLAPPDAGQPPSAQILAGHLDRVSTLAFSANDLTLASGSWDATVRLWHVESAQEVATLKAHHGKVHALAFSVDGNVLASGGERDSDHGEVFFWRGAK